MKRRLFWLGAVSLWVAASAAIASPIGEVAKYQLDTTRTRTSALLRSGDFQVKVQHEAPNDSMNVGVQYNVVVAVRGRMQGNEEIVLPNLYFSPEFISMLRASGVMTTQFFNVKHEGYADVKTLDGRLYPACDKLFVYDVQTFGDFASSHLLQGILNALQAEDSPNDGIIVSGPLPVDNVLIRMSWCAEIPALKAAKIDISGSYNGLQLKGGGDFIAAPVLPTQP